MPTLFLNRDVITTISSFLYREQIQNLYASCLALRNELDDSYKFIYKICLHHKPHSVNDKPIIEDGVLKWYKEGVLHRDGDKPALINDNNSMKWYRNGMIHRDEDKPAVISIFNGIRKWFKYDKLHRDKDMPAVVYLSGYRAWYKNGQRHRDNHKPAIIWADNTAEYWVNNEKITEK